MLRPPTSEAEAASAVECFRKSLREEFSGRQGFSGFVIIVLLEEE
jgi:hypothetical protein